jgi:hypothetical protein
MDTTMLTKQAMDVPGAQCMDTLTAVLLTIAVGTMLFLCALGVLAGICKRVR